MSVSKREEVIELLPDFFIEFLKKEDVLGDYITHCDIDEIIEINNSSKVELLIDYPVYWEETPLSWDRWWDLHSKWENYINSL